jgi:putative NADPH-quinone reductase
MRDILVILAHPDTGSLNFAIARRCVERIGENGHRAIFHDLYREGFDPVLGASEIPEGARVDDTVQTYCRELAAAKGLVIVHPNWWGMPPAILTGWIDRVFRPGVAYRFGEGDSGEGVPEGLLKGKTALVLNTSNTSPAREQAVFGDPLEAFWKTSIFEFCGITRHYRMTFSVVVTSTEEERRAWLNDAAGAIDRHFPKE